MKRFASLLLVAVMLLATVGCSGNIGTSDTPDETTAESETPAVIDTGYAADTLFADGNVLTDGEGDLTVAFIGGAVTSGEVRYDVTGKAYSENNYIDEMLYYFRNKFPKKNIRAYGAGYGAGGSGYSSALDGATVFTYAPDIVFLEFTCADSLLETEQIEKNIEDIVMQAQALEKVPVLCMVISAFPVDENDSRYADWARAAETEKKIAEKYGILTVDVYPVIIKAFEDSGSDDITIWRMDYFSSSNPAPASRDSYLFYSDTIISAIENSPSAFYTRLPEGKGIATEVITPDSDRLTYEGEWTLYTYVNQFVPNVENNEDMMKTEYYDYMYPRFFHGIESTVTPGSAVSFDSSADSFSILTHVNMRGSIAKVYVDGEFYCAIATGTFDRRKALTDETLYPATVHNVVDDNTNGCVTVDLPADGQSHNIKIAAEELEGSHLTFRFGYIVEKTAVK